MNNDTYRVFKRAAWTKTARGYEPYVGRKMTVRHGCTLEEAHKLCREGPANKLLREGVEYRGHTFYEFERE